MFFKLVCYDIKNGLFYQYKKYSIVCIVFLIFTIDLYIKRLNYSRLIHTEKLGTFMDYILYPFAGMKEYIPRPDVPFIFPVIWMIIYLMLSYIILYYTYNDLTGFGQKILLSTGKRRSWWLSKCIWVVLSVITFFLIAWITIFLFCIAAKIPISFTVTKEIFDILNITSDTSFYSKDYIILVIFILPVITMIAVNLFQTALSLIVKPIFSFAMTAALLLTSAYYLSPFFIGNYAMPIRNKKIVENGVSFVDGLLFALILSIVSIFIGWYIFERKDILGEEE